ncbi:MAG: hypothetical protein NVS1B3_07150 [Candidatus Dormibacteraceae bacterium]
MTRTATALVTTAGGEIGEGMAGGELVRDELAACGDGDLVAPLLNGPHAHARAAATRTSAEARRRVPMTIKATTLCAAGYVSGTILNLKQGTDPHPQGLTRRGCG